MKKSPQLGFVAIIVLAAVLGMVAAAADEGENLDVRNAPVAPELRSGLTAPVPREDQLPDCVPVDAGGMERGCVRKEQLYATPDEMDALREQSPLGLPVYASDTSDRQIGYLTQAGFVPNELAGRYDEVLACQEAFSAKLNGAGEFPSSCHDILLAQGTDTRLLESVQSGTGHKP